MKSYAYFSFKSLRSFSRLIPASFSIALISPGLMSFPGCTGITILFFLLFIMMTCEPFWRITLKPSFSKILISLFGLIGGILGKCFHFLYADDFLSQKIFLFLFS